MAEKDEGITGDDWREFHAIRRAKRASNREASPELLRKEGFEYTSHNGGVHLVIKFSDVRVDFWPGTGLWRTASGLKGRGVRQLIKYLKGVGDVSR